MARTPTIQLRLHPDIRTAAEASAESLELSLAEYLSHAIAYANRKVKLGKGSLVANTKIPRTLRGRPRKLPPSQKEST